MVQTTNSASKLKKYNNILAILAEWTKELPNSKILERNRRYYEAICPDDLTIRNYIGMTATLIDEYNKDRKTVYADEFWSNHPTAHKAVENQICKTQEKYNKLYKNDQNVLDMVYNLYLAIQGNGLQLSNKYYNNAVSVFINYAVDSTELMKISVDTDGRIKFHLAEKTYMDDENDFQKSAQRLQRDSNNISKVMDCRSEIQKLSDSVKEYFKNLNRLSASIEKYQEILNNPTNIQDKVF